MAATPLSPSRYLAAIEEEGEQLLAAAEGALALPVPTCDGWSVDDVVFHLGSVYSHKVAVVRLGRRPEVGEWQVAADDTTPEQDLAWCHEMLHALVTTLSACRSGEPAWTFWAPDQTVDFWWRRMALETAVHRVDVQSATGAVTPVADDLALDGVAEMLDVHLPAAGHPLPASVESAASGCAVRWPEVMVDGRPGDVLLWMWGRAPDTTVSLTGDAAAVARIRAGLWAAAQ
jgi:uncharacterized protein (TIGR03083 family)